LNRLPRRTYGLSAASIWILGLSEGNPSAFGSHPRNPRCVGIPLARLEYCTHTAQNPIFFYKGHIMAGQVRVDGKSVKDFAWLTKEEVGTRLDAEYWEVVKDILSDS
jgi:hypothetical protein